jgi:hypothetical protein
VAEALTWPRREVLDGLCRGGSIEATAQVLAADHAEDLVVDEMRSGVIVVGGKPPADGLGAMRADQDLAQAGGVNDQMRRYGSFLPASQFQERRSDGEHHDHTGTGARG